VSAAGREREERKMDSLARCFLGELWGGMIVVIVVVCCFFLLVLFMFSSLLSTFGGFSFCFLH